MHQASVPVGVLLALLSIHSPDWTQTLVTGALRAHSEGVPEDYLAVLLSQKMPFEHILSSWKQGIPLEYATAALGE
jgi:hypothetical protein